MKMSPHLDFQNRWRRREAELQFLKSSHLSLQTELYFLGRHFGEPSWSQVLVLLLHRHDYWRYLVMFMGFRGSQFYGLGSRLTAVQGLQHSATLLHVQEAAASVTAVTTSSSLPPAITCWGNYQCSNSQGQPCGTDCKDYIFPAIWILFYSTYFHHRFQTD